MIIVIFTQLLGQKAPILIGVQTNRILTQNSYIIFPHSRRFSLQSQTCARVLVLCVFIRSAGLPNASPLYELLFIIITFPPCRICYYNILNFSTVLANFLQVSWLFLASILIRDINSIMWHFSLHRRSARRKD